MRYTSWLAPLLLVALATSGCSEKSIVKPLSKETPVAPIGERKVKVDGQALALGQPESGVQARDAFLNRFAALLAENRVASARLWAQRHPDIALQVLREATNEQAKHDALVQLASCYDEQCQTQNGAQSWRALILRRREEPDRFRKFDDTRDQLLVAMRNAKFEEAAQIDLVGAAKGTGSPLLEADAYELHGVCGLLVEQPAHAVAAFERSIALVAASQPHQAAHTLLLLSEAKRRAGDPQHAIELWRQSIVAESDLLARNPPIADPTFWERASYLQPLGQPWPAHLGLAIAKFNQSGSMISQTNTSQGFILCSYQDASEPPATAALWACLGEWRLERGEGQAGLLAFKKAESACATQAAADWARLGQARSLLALGQSAAATAIWMQLAARPGDPVIERAALADLGALRVRDGMTLQGLELLKKSVEAEPYVEWPGRAAAEADLGLAYLMVGDEAAGLACLERASQRMQSQGDLELLSKTLWNQARYHEHKGNRAAQKAISEQLAQLQF